MSSTNKTSNLELSQFIGTDSPKWLTDYNSDMQKIDAGVAAVQTQADATDLVVAGHTSSIQNNTQSITDQQTAITSLRTDVTAAQGSINTINSLIGNGEPTTTDKTIIGAINELAAEMPGPTTQLPATSVSYSNTTSGLTASTVQAAIDELAQGAGSAASSVTYNNTTSGLAATNVQSAIDTLTVESTTAKVVGVDPDGKPIYEKIFKGNSLANNAVLDASLTYSAVAHFEVTGCFDKGNGLQQVPASVVSSNTNYGVGLSCTANGLVVGIEGYTVSHYYFKVRYSLNS